MSTYYAWEAEDKFTLERLNAAYRALKWSGVQDDTPILVYLDTEYMRWVVATDDV